MATIRSEFVPKINANDHGARIIIAGGIMLSATIFMSVVALYSRLKAKTLGHSDTLLLVLGVVLDIAFFALNGLAVADGLGRHVESVIERGDRRLTQLYLGSFIVFFMCHGTAKVSYNVLARKTARSRKFARAMDGCSFGVAVWILVSLVLVALHLTGIADCTQALFASGPISIGFVVVQLFSFLWIIWHTNAKFKAKIRWSATIGCCVPLLVVATGLRLNYAPRALFVEDWTFDQVPHSMLLLIELNLAFMIVLAPSLPVFFQKTSTGGVYFLPGEATIGSRSGNAYRSSRNDYALSDLYSGRGAGYGTATAIAGNGGNGEVSSAQKAPNKRASFDSDMILIRKSVEVEARSEAGKSETSKGGAAERPES